MAEFDWDDIPPPLQSIEWLEPSEVIDPPPLEKEPLPYSKGHYAKELWENEPLPLLPKGRCDCGCEKEVCDKEPPPPKKKRRRYTERKEQITKDQLEIAANQAFDLILDGNMGPSHPVCSDIKCKDTDPIFDDTSASWICSNCAVVLAERYISHEAPRYLTDKDTGVLDDNDTQKHHYTEDKVSSVITCDGITLTRTILESGYNNKRMRLDPLQSAIKRALDTAQVILKDHRLRLFNNGEVESRTNQLITDFIHIRSGNHLTAALKSSSTTSIAVAAVLQAGHEMGIGLRRDELHGVLGVDKAPKSLKSHWSLRMKRDLNLTAIPREWMLFAYLNRYINLIGNMTETEKQHATTLASWVRCMLSAVQLFPRPGLTGVPYTTTIDPIMDPCHVASSSSSSKRDKPRIIGHLLPGSNKIIRLPSSSSSKKKKHANYNEWVIQVISHTNDIRLLETKEQDDYWCGLIHTSIEPAASPLVITKASDEWHIRRMRVSSLAACILWLIIRLRPPRPIVPVATTPQQLEEIPKTLSRRQLQRRSAAQSIRNTTSSSSSPKLYRLTQKQISLVTGVADASFARCRKALYVVGNCLITS